MTPDRDAEHRPTDRQRLPWPWWRRLLREVVVVPLDLDNGTDGLPSLTKILAWATFALAAYAVVRKVPISGTQLTLVLAAISAAFGRSVWKGFLGRTSVTVSTSAVDTTARQLTEVVAARRDPDAGYEVAK